MKLGAHAQLRPTREAAMAAFAKELAEGMTKPCSRSKAAPRREPSAMSDHEPAPPYCPHCHEPMKLIRTIAHLGEPAEVFVFYCAPCKHAEMTTVTAPNPPPPPAAPPHTPGSCS
jgi:hypothetical protein